MRNAPDVICPWTVTIRRSATDVVRLWTGRTGKRKKNKRKREPLHLKLASQYQMELPGVNNQLSSGVFPTFSEEKILIEGVEARFKELVVQICEQNDFDLLAIKCHIFVNAPPDVSAAEAVKIIKTNTSTSRHLLSEFFAFERTQNL